MNGGYFPDLKKPPAKEDGVRLGDCAITANRRVVRLPIVAGIAVVTIAALAGCTHEQQAAFQAPAVYATVTNPNVSVSDKACAVLDWGLPIAQGRVDKLTGTQLALANGASQAAAAYCAGKDLSWQQRAVQAADSLSKVLWDVVR